MSEKTRRNVSIVGDISFSNLKIAEPQTYAGGTKALKVALNHMRKEVGLFKSIKTLNIMNQQDGFDCPGCAWADPESPSKLGEYCENGVKAMAEEATFERVDRDFFKHYSVEQISQWTDFKIGKSGRITEPFILRPGSVHYEPISWTEAYKTIAKELHQLSSPDEAIFYTSGRSSNEAAFLYGLFARAMGTNNMPDCSNMCHESSGVALSETLGIGKGSVTLDDLPSAEVIMVIGQNPGTNHPRMLTSLQECKDNGGKVITINPIAESGLVRFRNPQKVGGIVGSGTVITDIFLQVRVNQDTALLKLIMKRLIARHSNDKPVLDVQFISDKTAGYDEMVVDLDNYKEEDLLALCGVENELINQTVDLLAEKSKIIICWAMGLTQHENGVDNIKECVNLLLMKGSIGKKGAGTCPVRGHSNVQGDRSVGIMHHVSEPLNKALKETFGINAPNEEGLDVVNCIQAMHKGSAKVFVALGGNFLSAAPDSFYTAKALENCDLTVSISTKLNRTHLVAGKTSIILPTLGRTERDSSGKKDRFVTVENTMGVVHQSKGRLDPASDQLKSEPDIVASIAQAYFGDEGTINWNEFMDDYGLIREKISEVFTGYENYSERSKGAGFYLPNNARIADFAKLPGGKARFSICRTSSIELQKDEFLLMTFRSHDQFNTTIYDLNDRYRGVYGERRIIFMNAEDMKERGLKKEQVVDLTSNYSGKERRAQKFKLVPYDIPRGNLGAYFPETNTLIPVDQFAKKSNTPVSKSVIVKIEANHTCG